MGVGAQLVSHDGDLCCLRVVEQANGFPFDLLYSSLLFAVDWFDWFGFCSSCSVHPGFASLSLFHLSRCSLLSSQLNQLGCLTLTGFSPAVSMALINFPTSLLVFAGLNLNVENLRVSRETCHYQHSVCLFCPV